MKVIARVSLTIALAAFCASTGLAWDQALQDRIEREPDRHGTFIANPINDIYFLGKSGDRLVFNSRPFQPMSNWGPTQTALYLVDAKTGAELKKIDTKMSIDFHMRPGGKEAEVADRDIARLYDLQSGAVSTEFSGDGAPRGMNWSPDGRLFTYQGEWPSILNVYDMQTRSMRTLRKNRFAQLHSPAWNADSKTLALLEDSGNILSQTIRTIQLFDADPVSPTFGEVKKTIKLSRSDIKDLHRIAWASPSVLVGWYRNDSGKGYFEVVVDAASGAVLGTGRADDESASDTDALWTYTGANGKSGDFGAVFGLAHPHHQDPLPVPGAPHIRQHRWEPLSDTLALWPNVAGHFDHNAVADHAGNPLFAFKNRHWAHVELVGKVLRVYNHDGTFDEYDMK
jgi:hypothetical protein